MQADRLTPKASVQPRMQPLARCSILHAMEEQGCSSLLSCLWLFKRQRESVTCDAHSRRGCGAANYGAASGAAASACGRTAVSRGAATCVTRSAAARRTAVLWRHRGQHRRLRLLLLLLCGRRGAKQASDACQLECIRCIRVLNAQHAATSQAHMQQLRRAVGSRQSASRVCMARCYCNRGCGCMCVCVWGGGCCILH